MKKSITILLTVLLTISVIITGCVSNTSQQTTAVSEGTTAFTLSDLAKFDGQNGNKAYIAFNGKVYDISDQQNFVNGVHIFDSRIKAGTDISQYISSAPPSHKTRFQQLHQVGILH